MTRVHLAAVAALALAGACRTGAPYVAPAPAGAPAVGGAAAAKVRVLVVAAYDPQVTPPWQEKAERAADAVATALAAAGFRAIRGSGGWDVRVTVSAPLRGPDLEILVDDGRGRLLDRLGVRGAAWGPEERAELGRAVSRRLERSEAVAALAGVAPTAPAGTLPPPAAAPVEPGPPAAAAPAPAAKRLVVLEFRGAAPPQVLALLADQARAAAAEAGRRAGTIVLTAEAVAAALEAQGRPAEPCRDGPCQLETARAAGASLLVSGEVTAIGDARVLVLKLVDAGTGALVASQQAQARDDLALVDAARPAAAALFR